MRRSSARTSALGQFRKSQPSSRASALPLKADSSRTSNHVRKVPKPDAAISSKCSRFPRSTDHWDRPPLADTVKKDWGGERSFLQLLIRFVRGMRDRVASQKIDQDLCVGGMRHPSGGVVQKATGARFWPCLIFDLFNSIGAERSFGLLHAYHGIECSLCFTAGRQRSDRTRGVICQETPHLSCTVRTHSTGLLCRQWRSSSGRSLADHRWRFETRKLRYA
jgi:hypothetical protein